VKELAWIRKAKSTLPIGEDMLNRIGAEIAAVNSDFGTGVRAARTTAENTRFCKWDGQSADGKKHKTALNKDPFPFDGASDQRVPVVDMVVEEKVALAVMASMTAFMVPQVRMMGIEDAASAAALERVLRYEVTNRMGLELFSESTRLANFVYGDNPGLGVLKVWWKRERGVVLETWTLEEAAKQLDALAEGAVHPDTGETAGQFFLRALATESLHEEAAELMRLLAPEEAGDADFVTWVREAQKTGKLSFPTTYLRSNRVAIRALRPFEDVWYRTHARSGEDVEMWFEREWLTAVQVKAEAQEEDWSEDFVTALCGDGKEKKGRVGASLFSEVEAPQAGYFADTYRGSAIEQHADEYEIVRVHFSACDRSGVRGWYWTTVAAGVKIAAHDARLQDYKHGESVFLPFQAEFLRGNMLDSRGESQRLGSMQWALKQEVDMHNDRTTLTTVPPVIGPFARAGQKFTLQPGGYLPELRSGELRWMPSPDGQGVRDNETHQALLWRITNEYSGRSAEGVPPDAVQLRRQFLVLGWLAQWARVQKRMAQLICQYRTDEEIVRILGGTENPLPKTLAEIHGLYDTTLWIDPRDLTDTEHLTKVTETVLNGVVQLDKDGQIDTGPIAVAILSRLDPRLAALTAQPPQQALARQEEEERQTITAIAAGLEPRLLEGVNVNYLAKIGVLRSWEAQNQADIAQWSEEKKAQLEKHKKNLLFGLQQQENAQTGRTGVERKG
jgi:hypothetical protein